MEILLLEDRFYVLFVRYKIKLCTMTIFVIVDFQAAFHMYCIGMLMICLHIKYHMHSTKGLSIIFIKMKSEGNFCMITMLIFYILQLSKFTKDAYSKVSYCTFS